MMSMMCAILLYIIVFLAILLFSVFSLIFLEFLLFISGGDIAVRSICHLMASAISSIGKVWKYMVAKLNNPNIDWKT